MRDGRKFLRLHLLKKGSYTGSRVFTFKFMCSISIRRM
jgi:hypothetical protein